MTHLDDAIKQFFNSSAFGVVGASNNRQKYGNKVLRVYFQNGKKVYPVNPNEDVIEGIPAVSSVKDLPAEVKSISIITPPAITEQVVAASIQHGIKNIWMQPGAASDKAIKLCEDNKINVLAKGPCILVELHYHEV